MFINLAPLKYFSIVENPNGPIEKTNVIKWDQSPLGPYYEVQTFLRPHLRASSIERSQIYGSCDATGTDRYLQVAFWKSMSEAIERWAFHSLIQSQSQKYGMAVDSTSTGFAALPCWPKGEARQLAFNEALERWALSNWWRGHLNCSPIKGIQMSDHVKAVQILVPNRPEKVVIVFDTVLKDQIHGPFSYGFASAADLKVALLKARIEKLRNEKALAEFKGIRPESISDRRLLFFSTHDGYKYFQQKLEHHVSSPVLVPNLVVDSKISGPWDRYATVWRCLLPDTEYNWSDERHFMF